MPNVLYDLKYLAAGLDELEAYLLSGDLYWQTGASAPPGEPEFPSLTLGGLLMARQRLMARRLEAAHQPTFLDAQQRLEHIRGHWRVAWGRKAQRSFMARLTQWNNYLADYGAQPEAFATQYPQEVRVRLMLALLQPEADLIDPSALDLLKSLDALLRVQLQPAPFIWEADLAGGFSPVEYWYLYGRLRD